MKDGDMCSSASPLLVQDFDKRQLRVGILKGRKAYLKNRGRTEAGRFAKLWLAVGGQKTREGRKANIFHLSVSSSVWVTGGKGDRRERAENSYPESVLQEDARQENYW